MENLAKDSKCCYLYFRCRVGEKVILQYAFQIVVFFLSIVKMVDTALSNADVKRSDNKPIFALEIGSMVLYGSAMLALDQAN